MKHFLPVEEAVLRILSYASVFGAGVAFSDLERFQTGDSNFSQEELSAAAHTLQTRGLAVPVPLPLPEVVQAKWSSIREAVKFFRRFSAIESIWLTGSVAAGSVKPEDDIDLMIITSTHRLWLTRVLVELNDLLSRKIRRRGDENGPLSDKWCCNLWLETGTLALPTVQHSLYTAREIIQAVPLYQRKAGSAESFLHANSWVEEVFPLGFRISVQRARDLPSERVRKPHLSAFGIVSGVNAVCFLLQRKRMQRYLQHEIVELHRAFFHPEERARRVEEKCERILALSLKTSKKQ